MTPRRRKKLRRVYSATKAWVRAEFAFRCGPAAYGNETTKRYLKAEGRLRKALIGTRGLGKAGKRLGCIDPDLDAERQKHLKKLAGVDSVPKLRKEKPLQRRRFGLFD